MSLLATWALSATFLLTLGLATAFDVKYRIIPNLLLLISCIFILALLLLEDPNALPSRIIFALLSAGLLFIAAVIYPTGMGMGDVKMVGVMGLFLGSNVIVAMIIALIIGVIWGAVIVVAQGLAKGRKAGIPFGVCLALGGIVAWLWGDSLSGFYMSF